MADAEWVENIKKIVLQAMEAGDPCNVVTGLVLSAEPLSVQIDQKITVMSTRLIVPEHLTDHPVEMLIPETGKVIVQVKNGLRAGDAVLLLQKRGGQEYLVLGRQ